MASSAAAAVAATALLTPPMSARSKLRRYRKLRKLGQGAFGSVFLCLRVGEHAASRASSRVSSAAGERTVRGRLGWEDEVDMHYRGDMEVEACLELSKFSGQPLCVMKHIDTSRRGKKAHDQALQEAKFLHELDHPNIINVWDYFSEGGSVFIVMEYAAGGDLADMVKIRKTQQHYMTEREVLLLVVQMVSALAHLHSRKIIHRDFKSPNVFLTSNGMVKLGDFGIARSLDNSLDHAETQVGTPFYYSPEVCKGEPYNHKSDVWSLGVVTYELCSLRRPFESGNIAHLATLIVSQEPEALHERYSTDLRRMVAAFLSKEPVSRPSMGSIMHLPWLTAPLHAASKLVEEGIQEAHAASSAATVGDSSDDESNDEVEEEEQERRRKIRARRHHKRNSSLFPASILHPPSQVDCAGCNKPIRGVCVEAGGERPLFHPHCFRCSQCDREISSGWVERNGDKGGRLCLSCDLAAKQEELLKQEQKEDEEEGEEEEDEEEVYEEDYEEYESGEEAGVSEGESGREAKEEEEEEEEEGKEEEEEAAVGGAGEDISLALQLGGLLAGLPEEDEDDEDEDTWTCNSCSRQNPSSFLACSQCRVEKEWREDGPRTFRRTSVDGAVAGVEEGVEEEEEDGGGGDAVSPTATEGEGGEGGKEAGGEEVSELKEWQCPMCTLLNSNRRACAACGYLSDALANLAKDRQAFLDYTERLEGILQRKRLVKQAQKVKHKLKKGKASTRRATARSGAGGRAGPGERNAGEGTTRLKRGKRSPKGSPKSVATSRVRRSMGGASDGKGRVKKGSTVRRRSKAGEKMATAASPVASISPLGIKRDAKGYRIKGQGSPSLRSPPAGPGTSSSSSPTLSSPPSQTSPATTRLSRLGKTEVLSGKGLVPSNANAKDKMGKRFRF